MAATYIAITASTQRAQQLQQYIRLLAQVDALGQQLAGQLNAMVNGNDYTEIETLFGLQTGQGQPLYNLVVGANAAVDVLAITQLINGVG
jgi:hypothetical protein